MPKEGQTKASSGGSFRQFFFRGLGIVLPTVLTIWILLAAYQFVQARIAQPINQGVKRLVITTTPFPRVTEQDIQEAARLAGADPDLGRAYRDAQASGLGRLWIITQARRAKLERWWSGYSIVLNLIGLVLAIMLIYAVGVVLGSYIGRKLYNRGERLLNHVPLIRRVYPSVKQVTDFFVGDPESRPQFNRVVAVQYPRKGIWSIGLVTGQTMTAITNAAGIECLTVFVPNSPTPFTGYVITVPRQDTLEMPITVEDALKFVVSGGVLIPPSQKPRIDAAPMMELATEPATA